jgi:hypothetical protein
MLVNETATASKNPSITSSKLDNETILLNIDTGDYYTLNSTGAEIWALLDSALPVGEIIDVVAAKFSISKEKSKDDVSALLNTLAEEHLIVFR